MRLIQDTYGNFMSVYEEFTCKARHDSASIYYVVNCFGKLYIYNNGSKRKWSKQDFIEYYEKSKTSTWRNLEIKEYYLNLYEKIISSIIKVERDIKIDEIFRDEMEHQYWLC